MPVTPADQIPIKVKVKTSIRDGQHTETFELTTFGKYYIKDLATYLQYEEVMEEGNIKTIVKLTEDEALILRSGAVKMRMPFKMNKRLKGSYQSPYGVMDTMTTTKRLEHTFNDMTKEGSVEILYDLKMQGSPAGTYHLNISFEEEPS